MTKRQPTAYETLCYLASQERADEIKAFARAEAEADEREANKAFWFGLGFLATIVAVLFFTAM